VRKEARRLIKSANKLLEERLRLMSGEQMKLDVINEYMQFSGARSPSQDGDNKLNAALQEQNRRQALEVVSSQFKHLTGRSFSFEEVDEFLKEKNTYSVLKGLIENKTIKGTRFSKKIEFKNDPELKLFLNKREIKLTNISEKDKNALYTKIQECLSGNRLVDKESLRALITETQVTVFEHLVEAEKISSEAFYQVLAKDLYSEELKKYQCFEALLSQLMDPPLPFTKKTLQEHLEKYQQTHPEHDASLYIVDDFLTILEKNGLIEAGVKVLDTSITYKITQGTDGQAYLYRSKLGLPLNHNQGVDTLWKELIQHGVIKNYALNVTLSNDESYDEIDSHIKKSKELSDFLLSVRGRLYEFKNFVLKKRNYRRYMIKIQDKVHRNNLISN
jgi:hypothetical protein